MKDKLIRANNLLEQIESPYTEYSVMARIRSAIKEMIDEAPTVDAIPIEWIEKQIGKALSVDSCDMFYARNLKYLIKEWRKENE